MKHTWCSGFPEIYAQLEEGIRSGCHDDLGMCAFYYICNCFGVVVLHRSTVNWRRGDAVCVHWYLCILLYGKLMQSRGLPQMYGQLEEGWGLSALVFVYSSLCET